jgi:predicted metalloendopeptidase
MIMSKSPHFIMFFCVLFLSIVNQDATGDKSLASGIDQSMMDTSVKPQDDFYLYANGNWLKEYDIPADRSSYGIFAKLRDDAEENLKLIIEESANAKDKPQGSNVQKIGDMYLSFMDSAKVEKLGLNPIKPQLEAISNLKNKRELVQHIARLEKTRINNPFSPYIFADQKNSKWPIVNMYQGGLSLPDRDYYLKDNERFNNIKNEFLAHMEKMFELASIADGKKKAEKILEIETKIAEQHWTRVDNRDPDKTYNKVALANMNQMMPDWDWQIYSLELGIADEDSLRIYQPSYLQALNDVFKSESLEDWKTYYTWRVLTNAAGLLSSDFVTEDFNFYRKTLRGIEEQRPRWKRGVTVVRNALGEVLGKSYVERHFKPEAKARMQNLVDNLLIALKEQINDLEWMSEETKAKALIKLSTFKTKIGYPDKWIDYSSLEIKRDDLYGNVMRGVMFEINRDINKLGKPIDPDEWGMTPQTVNAGYNPTKNDITFPAAILQPPFFNMEADDAVNYGAIGAAIGHEITHGFDDKGRKSDGDGNLVNWWTEEDNKKFEKRAQVMIDQYNAFIAIDTMNVNGELTLGENIADLGGLTIAFNAYKKSLNGKKSQVIDGFTGEERFFLGFGQIWATKFRDEALRRRLMTDVHSPGQYRVLGVLSNMPEFYETYDVKEGDGMFRPEQTRVKIW